MTDANALSFLRQTLKIEDAGLLDYVEDLRILARAGSVDSTEVETLYRKTEVLMEGQRNRLKSQIPFHI